MRKILSSLLLLLSVGVNAEMGSFQSACFKGLNDVDSPATLNPCNSPDLLNTESNFQGTAIVKRKGFQKVQDLTVTTGPVTGSHSFIDSSGNRLDIVCNDRYCAKSTNGNAFTNFLTTAAANVTRWSFVDVGGNLYGANNRQDPILKYDGTTLSYPATMPRGSILEMAQERLVVGDVSGSPNRVHYSSAGSYENFNTGINSEDPWFDEIGAPGDKIRGLKYINGNLFVFKSNSITICEVQNQYNTSCSVLSPNLGTTDPGSITTAGDYLYFRAQDKNYWEMGPQGLKQISRQIQNLVKSQSGGLGGGENSNTQTTQTDWQNGVQSPTGTWNTTAIPGSIFPSSITFVDNSSNNWTSGSYNLNIDTVSNTNSIKLSSDSFTENWAASVAGVMGWIQGDKPFETNNGAVRGKIYFPTSVAISAQIYSSVTFSSGSYHIEWQKTGFIGPGSCYRTGTLGACMEFRFVENAGGDYYSFRVNEDGASIANSNIEIVKSVSGSATILTRRAFPFASNTIYSFDVNRSTDGRMWLYRDGVFVSSTPADVAISSSVHVRLLASAGEYYNEFDNFRAYQYKSSGTIVSRIFDTTVSTPTFGRVSSTATVSSAEGAIFFYTQSSNDGTSWSAFAAASDTIKITSPSRRYIRYKADFYTYLSSVTPILSSIGLQSATTGMFVTQCIQPGVSISTWGALNCSVQATGNASVVFYTTSAATCDLLPTIDPIGWQNSIVNNASLTISTNTALKIGFRSLLTSATEQLQVDACNVSWTEGTSAQPSWAAFDSVKNAVYWTTTVGGASSSNRLLKYDRNLDEWYPFNIPAQAPRIINNNLYFGGASSGTWNLYGGVDSDNGFPIDAYWKSKDIGSDQPFLEKDFKTLSILSRNNGTGTMNGTYTFSNSQTGNYSISLSTGNGITYARSNYNLPRNSPQNFLNIKLWNNTTTPFEVLGLGSEWVILPWKVSGP